MGASTIMASSSSSRSVSAVDSLRGDRPTLNSPSTLTLGSTGGWSLRLVFSWSLCPPCSLAVILRPARAVAEEPPTPAVALAAAALGLTSSQKPNTSGVLITSRRPPPKMGRPVTRNVNVHARLLPFFKVPTRSMYQEFRTDMCVSRLPPVSLEVRVYMVSRAARARRAALTARRSSAAANYKGEVERGASESVLQMKLL
jgi:hypothetical protein